MPIADRRLPIALITTLLVGCDGIETAEKPAALPRELKTGTGIVRGEVRFVGTPPVMKTIANQPCHEGASAIAEETVVVNGNGTLRNVFVYLEGAGTSEGSNAAPAVLDQVNCQYVPHAIGVQVGQELTICSSDPTIHNVHALANDNRAMNFGMTKAGEKRNVTFEKPEFIPVKCDVHPWMMAWIGVFENPFFAVTREDGTFELKNLPEGAYTLVAWHERYGRLEQHVTIDERAPLQASFDYKQQASNNK